MIKGFFGEYRFLSNYHLATITYEGIDYRSSEHAYHSAKSSDPKYKEALAKTEAPNAAKKIGRNAVLRPDWEQVKLEVMTEIVRQKFTRHADLKKKLLDTGDQYLEETNTWGDRFWGVDGTGENNLGKILMRIREELRSA